MEFLNFQVDNIFISVLKIHPESFKMIALKIGEDKFSSLQKIRYGDHL